jgi:hypothetical protein
VPGLSHEPHGKSCVVKVVAVEEIHAGAHGVLNLLLEVVVDAEALEVVDGSHHLPVPLLIPAALMKNRLHVGQALLNLMVCIDSTR